MFLQEKLNLRKEMNGRQENIRQILQIKCQIKIAVDKSNLQIGPRLIHPVTSKLKKNYN